MGVALGFTGWWMYIDVPATPKAVVACVIIFNAAFGYRYAIVKLFGTFDVIIFQLGTNSMALSPGGDIVPVIVLPSC